MKVTKKQLSSFIEILTEKRDSLKNDNDILDLDNLGNEVFNDENPPEFDGLEKGQINNNKGGIWTKLDSSHMKSWGTINNSAWDQLNKDLEKTLKSDIYKIDL